MDLHVDSVVKSYGDRRILTDAWISCRTGETVGLLGRNGSGKSTLLRIIFGTVAADNKFIRVGDTHISRLHDTEGLIKYLPQDRLIPNDIKIVRAIDMMCKGSESELAQDNPVLKPFLDKKAGSLSGGERRLAEVIIMLHSNARFVLLDEPFKGISPLVIGEIKELIRTRALSGDRGFIITDHDYRNVMDISHRIFTIKRGVVVEAGESVTI